MLEIKTSKGFTPKYFSAGLHKAKITNITIAEASTGSKKLVFDLEGEEVEGFEGADGKNCTVGRVSTFYMAKDESVPNTLRLISQLAGAVGEKSNFSEEDLYTATGEVITDIKNVGVDQISQIHAIAVKLLLNKFIYVNLKSEEYVNNNTGKIGTNLYFQYVPAHSVEYIKAVDYNKESKTQTVVFTDEKKASLVIDFNDEKVAKKVAKPDVQLNSFPIAQPSIDVNIPNHIHVQDVPDGLPF
jgi:hypothetical protein